MAQDATLARGVAGEIGFFETPANLGVAGESAGAGAGRVDEDAVEDGREGQGLSGVQTNEARAGGVEIAQAGGARVAGDGGESGRLEGLGSLVAGRGAEVEKELAGRELEQRDDGLRTDVLAARARGQRTGEEPTAGKLGGLAAGRRFGGTGRRM